jgi:hypothetical protein
LRILIAFALPVSLLRSFICSCRMLMIFDAGLTLYVVNPVKRRLFSINPLSPRGLVDNVASFDHK